jgi:Ankyrin repeats (3 copies)
MAHHQHPSHGRYNASYTTNNDEMEQSYAQDEEFSYMDEGESLAESLFSAGNDAHLVDAGDNAVPDIMLLNVYCARAKAPKDTESSRIEAERSWDPVRSWLSSHNAEEVRSAAEQRGESGLTALHFAARHCPPLDVMDVLLSIAVDTVQWPDSFGWLPIHYACASGSDADVIKALAEAYPESKTTVDRRGRTPLHFALGDKPASPDVIFLLSSSGAASFPDEIGMLVSAGLCDPSQTLQRNTWQDVVLDLLLTWAHNSIFIYFDV